MNASKPMFASWALEPHIVSTVLLSHSKLVLPLLDIRDQYSSSSIGKL